MRSPNNTACSYTCWLNWANRVMLCTMFNKSWWCTHPRICGTHRAIGTPHSLDTIFPGLDLKALAFFRFPAKNRTLIKRCHNRSIHLLIQTVWDNGLFKMSQTATNILLNRIILYIFQTMTSFLGHITFMNVEIL